MRKNNLFYRHFVMGVIALLVALPFWYGRTPTLLRLCHRDVLPTFSLDKISHGLYLFTVKRAAIFHAPGRHGRVRAALANGLDYPVSLGRLHFFRGQGRGDG